MGKPKGKKKPAKPAPAGKAPQENEEVIPHRSLYVGNLAGLNMTESKLKDLFECCGDVTSVSVVETAKHAFGFVEFATVAEAENAIEKMNGELDMLVKFAKNTASQPFAPPARTSAVEKSDDESSDNEESDDKERLADGDNETKPDAVAAPLLDLATARAAAARSYATPVETLHDFVQKATRAASTRDYIIYTDVEDDLGFYIATVELKVPAGRISHSGEPKENKKEAKKSAAQVALRDPAVHRLLPPLPKEVKVQEPKAVKVAVEADSDSDQSTEEGRPELTSEAGPALVLSKKEQQKLDKAELARKRKAAKAAKQAAWAALQEESGEDEEEEEDELQESAEDSSSEEEDSDYVSGSEDEDGSKIDAEGLAAKKAAIKAALAAKRAAKKGGAKVPAASKDKSSNATTELSKDKLADFKSFDKVKDSRLQANFGQTKFIKP